MIKVFIADDEAMIRNGIRNYIDKLDLEYTICGEAQDGEMALPLLQELKPDILIADVRMPILDGLELCAIVKRTMPWMHMVILSGHDEFEYAQKAVEIGVDNYVLKPVSFARLLEILDQIKEKIDKEAEAFRTAQAMQARSQQEQTIIQEHFLGQLVSGTISPQEIASRAQSHHIRLDGKYYVVCRIFTGQSAHGGDGGIRAMLHSLFDNEKENIIWFFHGADSLILIVKGSAEEEVLEKAYELAQLLRHELERFFSLDSYVGIGSIVHAPGELAQSYQDADRSLGSGIYKILSFADRTGQREPVVFAPKAPLEERLRHAQRQDIPTIVENHFADMDDTGADSLLFRFYLLTDLVANAARTLGFRSLDAVTDESPQDMFSVSSTRQKAVEYGIRVLERMLTLRGEAPLQPYSVEISKAKGYIAEHYSDPSISLHTVAAETGVSPNHFSTVFSQQTGESFVEYLTRKRIEAAKRMIVETDTRLSDIAWKVGYNDPHYFSYVFKKQAGMSPRDYRSAKQKKK